ncbi:MAG: HAD-IC family P-type ATPase [Clostridia bacterium]|nr:HAD-IC family P-type ATPase [Clostridia bacterium]
MSENVGSVAVPCGLTDEQARKLREDGFGNKPQKPLSQSYKNIIISNIFNIFNLINILIAAALCFVGSYKNCLFMIAVISNTTVGIVQEIRSKRVIDKLSIVGQKTVTVIRDGCRKTVDVSELVMGDIIEISGGCQVTNDCTVISGRCEVNESLVTGESDPIAKSVGYDLLSGSYIVGGSCLCKISAVGSDNYADSIIDSLRGEKRTSSEIVAVLDKIIGAVSVCIIPLGVLLFYNQMTQSELYESVESTAAALIGMIPEGLVLLTSTVFALGVVRLSKKNVLSQDLYSLEALARTDILCLDKTGTVTTGEMTVEKVEPLCGVSNERFMEYLRAAASLSDDNNYTIKAIRTYIGKCPRYTAVSSVPFSSERKWSSVTEKSIGTVILGAQKAIFGDETDDGRFRVIAVAYSKNAPCGDTLPDDIEPIGRVYLRETLRGGVGEAFGYFEKQGVDIRIISGDSPRAVSQLCQNAFVGYVPCIDMSEVSDDDIVQAAAENKIFGRTSPKQKRIIVEALQKMGHTVGMVGDGVNDVPALRQSDCSIAPAEGSQAARSVSKLVLLDSDFSTLPQISAEGRWSINNLERSAVLFLTKTIFSILMSLMFIIFDYEYPLEPIQMTLISTLTIGFPAFALSFMKNNSPVSQGMLRYIVSNSLPAALADIISVMTVTLLSARIGFSEKEVSSLCVTALAVTGIALIVKIYRPITGIKIPVMIVSSVGLSAAFVFFGDFFGFSVIDIRIVHFMLIIAAANMLILTVLFWIISQITARLMKNL